MLNDKRPALIVLGFALLAAAIACFGDVKMLILAAVLFLAAALFAATKNKTTVFMALLVGIAVISQALIIHFCAVNKLKSFDAKNVEICGTLCSSHKAGETYVSQTIKVSKIEDVHFKVPVKIKLLNSNGFVAKQGDNVCVIAKLEASQGTTYETVNFSQGIYASAKNAKFKSIQNGKNIYSLSGAVKAFVKENLEHYLPYDQASVLSAIIVGDSVNIDDGLYNQVIDSGVSHMLVVSGMHLSIICGMLIKVLRRFMSNRLAALLVLPFVLFIAVVCDFGYSIMRAAISYVIYLIGCMLLKRSDPISSLSIASTFILIYNPYALGSAALLLSATSTAGIIILSAPLSDRMCKGKRSLSKYITEPFCTTLGASVFCAPITMLLFGRISILSLITNVFVNYSITVALCASVVALLLCAAIPLEPLINLLFSLASVCIKYFCAIVRFIAGFNFASVDVTHIFAILCSILFVIVAVFAPVMIKRGKKQKLVKIAAIAIIPFAILSVYLNTSRTEITAVKLKNSQSVIISYGDSAVVIGAGGNLTDGKRVNAALQKLAVENVDALYIINSKESFAGANVVLKNNDVKEVLTAQNQNTQEKIKQYCNNIDVLPPSHSLPNGIKTVFFDNAAYVDINGYTVFIGDNQNLSPTENFCYNNANAHVYTKEDGTRFKTAHKTYVTYISDVRAKIKNNYVLISK